MAPENQPVNQDMKRQAKAEPIGMGAIIQNRYQVIAYLGRGGMSTVYKAIDMSTGRTVALKILHSELLSDTTRVQRFMQEAKTYRNLRHEHIVKTYDFFTDDFDRYCLVMEYHEGRNLSEVLSEQGRLSIRRAIKVFSEICDALEHAHSQGIVHRDLKPSNIALVEKENDIDYVKVLDFGIAKLMPTDSETQLGLTQTGEIVGSPLYMSPEQCMAKAIDHRSDIYSLGCLMYEGITGEPPLMGGNVYETFHMQTHERPRALAEVRPEFKSGTQFEVIIFKCMAKNPRHRYQTMGELKNAMQHVGTANASSGIGKLISAYNENKVKERAAKGKGIPPLVAAGATAVVIVACGFLFQDRIRQFIEPAPARYERATVAFRQAFDENRYDVAEQEAQKILRIAEEERSEWLIPALVNLVDLRRIQGKVKEAETFDARVQQLTDEKLKAVELREKKLFSKLRGLVTADDPNVEEIEDVCFQLSDLALGYIDSNQYNKARNALQKTLSIAQKSLGEKSLVKSNLIDNLALLRMKNNLDENYPDIERQLNEAIETRQEVAGGESTGLIRPLETLSEVQRRMGKLDDARANAIKALSIARNNFRSGSFQAAESKCQVAEIDLARKKPSEAFSAADIALRTMEQVKESDELDKARCHVLMGEAKTNKEEFSDALKELNIAREMLKEATDSQVLLLSRAYSCMGDIYSSEAKRDLEKAEGFYKRALALMFRSPAREEARVLHILDSLSEIYNRDSRAEEALDIYKLSEQVDKSTAKTIGVIEDRRLIGSYYREQLKFKDAIRYYEQALTLSQNSYGIESAETCELSALLAETYLKDKKPRKAEPLIYQAVKTLHSDAVKDTLSRPVKLKVLSIYSRYLETVGDKEKLHEVKEEINSV